MEETKNKGLGKNILIVILIILLGLSLAYIIYDNFSKKDKQNEQEKNNNIETNKENNNIENNNESSNLTELGKSMGLNKYDDFGIKLWFEDYIQNMPIHYENGAFTSYKVSNLTDKEISMFIWRYIWKNGDSSENQKEMFDSEVNKLLKEYLNLENYTLKELEKEEEPKEGQPWNIFGLNKDDDKYVATVIATEFSFENYRVSNVKYDTSTGEILVYFDNYDRSYWIKKIGEGIATYKLKSVDDDIYKPYLIQIEYSKIK